MRLSLALLIGLLQASPVFSQSYPYFPPPGIGYSASNGNITLQNMTLESVTGVVLCDGSSGLCSAAAASNIIPLWSGTPSSSLFLRSDGQLAAPAATAPAGTNGEVQYNNAGVFGGNSGFTTDGSGDITLSGTVTAALFSGSGASLTNLNGSNITSGTLSNSRLSGVALLAAANIYTSANIWPASGVAYPTTSSYFGAINTASVWSNSTGPTDSKLYDCLAAGTTDYQCRLVNDADNSATVWLDVNRTGMTVNAVNFPNGSLENAGTPVCLSNGTNCPANTFGTLSMILSSTGAGNPSIVTCNRCSSPSASRTSAGLWEINTGVALTRSMIGLCNISSAGPTSGTALFVYASTPITDQVEIAFYNTAGTATDPSSSVEVSCAVGL